MRDKSEATAWSTVTASEFSREFKRAVLRAEECQVRNNRRELRRLRSLPPSPDPEAAQQRREHITFLKEQNADARRSIAELRIKLAS